MKKKGPPTHGQRKGAAPPGRGPRLPRREGPDALIVDSQSAIAHVVEHRPDRVEAIQFYRSRESLKGRLLALAELAQEKGVRIAFTQESSSPSPVAARIKPFEFRPFGEVLESLRSKPRATVLLLDHLQDPQNFGAICRSAEAMGAAGVIVPKDRTVPISAGVYSASVGAVETLPMCEYNLAEAVELLKKEGFWVASADRDENAEEPWILAKYEKIALILGSEWEGVGALLRKRTDFFVSIPMAGQVESLNVSNAAAILLYERLRAEHA